MHGHRSYLRLKPQQILAISFDLDDTLYDNMPHILTAEAKLVQFLQQQYPRSQAWQFQQWRALKLQLINEQPHLAQDTNSIRLATLDKGLTQLGYSQTQASDGAHQGLQHFRFHRSNFAVSDTVLNLLAKLKKHVKLIGITNGNVDAKRIGLDPLFEFVLHPGNGVRMKPAPDMFEIACKRLQIAPSQLLHVGDSLSADVQGARLAQCQTAWLNPSFGQTSPKMLTTNAANTLLPHMEIGSLTALLQLFNEV